MEKYAGGSIAIICGSLLIEGTQSESKLTAAINGLYRLNPALRTRITETDEGTMQSVLEYTEQDIDILRFNSKDEFESYAEDYAKKPLNLYGELCELRGVFLPDRCGALIKLHHIVGDAWSMALLCSHLIALLNGEVPQAFPYAEHLENESVYLQSDRYAKDRAFFLGQFKKCDEVTYLSEKQSNSFIAARKTFVVDTDKTSKIIGYAKESSISLFVLFMTVVATYMNRTRQNIEKFYIGTAVLNRNGVRKKNMVGMFIDTVPVLIELNSNKAFSENLKAVAFVVIRN